MALRGIKTRRIFINDRDKNKQRTHIQFLLVCEWCNIQFWAGKSNAKTCSNSCRVSMCVANKKNNL